MYCQPIQHQKDSGFGKGGCALFGWPSSGGVLIKEPANIVDPECLSVNRLKARSSSINAVEKDVLCANMRKIGAKWWESEEDYIVAVVGERERTPQELAELFVDWLATEDVWILLFEDKEKMHRDFGRFHMALNMDERCLVIEENGGTFYNEAPDMEKIVAEWLERGFSRE